MAQDKEKVNNILETALEGLANELSEDEAVEREETLTDAVYRVWGEDEDVQDAFDIQIKKVENKDVFSTLKTGSYYYSGGWHIKAIYSLIIGFIFSASTIWNPEIRFLQSFSWIIGFFVSFIMYLLLAKK